MGGLLAAGQPDYAGTWAGRAGLSCAWAGCWMGKTLGGELLAGMGMRTVEDR